MIQRAARIQQIKSYYFATKLAEIDRLNASGDEVINLGIGSPDLDPPVTVLNKLMDVSAETGLHKYQSYRGIPELRTAFAKWYEKHFSIMLDPHNDILPLIGSKEGIMHISMSFIDPGDVVLVPDPGYPAYGIIGRICGGNIQTYPLEESNQYQIDIPALSEMDLSAVKLMWINYPHMPTGARAQAEVFESLVALARKHQFLICHDNPYAFILNDNPLSIFQFDRHKEVSLELTSLSKHYNMAGWRVGALVGNPEYVNSVLRFKSNMDSGMFKGIQLAAVEALEQSAEWFHDLNNTYNKRRQRIHELLDKLGCQFDPSTAGLFVWAKIPEGEVSGQEFSDKILNQYRIFITPGFIFGDGGQRYIRASLCQPITQIDKAIDRCK